MSPLMSSSRVRALLRLSLLSATLMSAALMSGCMRLDPDHPYDPDTPPEMRAKASVIGRLLLVNEPSNFSYESFDLILINAEFDDYVYTMPLNADGTFQVEGVLPGDYIITADGRALIDGAEGRYVLPRRDLFLPVGELVTVSTPYLLLPIERVSPEDHP